MDTIHKSSQTKKLPLALIFLGLGLILIVLSAYYVIQGGPAQTELSAVPVKVNYPAPELTLTDLQANRQTALADYRGQVVLVNLWATWCPPCKAEMPTLEAFYRKHRDDGFAIVAVNDGDPTADVSQFVDDYGLTFPVWLDPKYVATEQAFKTLNLPSSFVINREGTIVLSWVGGISRRSLEKYVTPIIKDESSD